jgi:serine/threonine-protein kinase
MHDPDAPRYFGRYQVLEELGSGAMGVVYLCVDERLARPVAVKVVKGQGTLAPAEREQFLARFRQEAEAAGRLSHPDVVQIYDVGPSYMVMEFVEGQPLSQVIRAAVPLLVGEIAALVQRVADALDYAHRQGIVHRDVKPANIMRLDDGGVKVMDFGVARLPSSTLTAFGTVVGSVRYMAPEQMMGRPVDGRADVFALGAVAYELLTGQAPFPGKTATDVVTRVVHGDYVPVCRVEPRLPAACDDVFARVFATDPERRFARAPDFALGLREAMRAVAPLCLRTPASGAAPPAPTTLVETAAEGQERTRILRAAPRAAESAPTVLVPPAGDEAYAATRLLTPPVAEALLSVESQPPGAQAQLDGRPLGPTPLVDLPLALGRHRLRLELDGHAPAAVELEASAARRLYALSFTLARAPAEVTGAGVTPFEPGMTPPRRIAGEPPAPPAGAAGGARTAVAECVVGADGQVTEVVLLESAGAACDRALVDALRGWTFTPALRGLTPVAVRLRVSHHFGG